MGGDEKPGAASVDALKQGGGGFSGLMQGIDQKAQAGLGMDDASWGAFKQANDQQAQERKQKMQQFQMSQQPMLFSDLWM